MTLKSMTYDELILFYYFLLENEKYTNIGNLKRAICSRIYLRKTNSIINELNKIFKLGT